MQRSVPEQRLGVFLYFHKHEHFHYFKLFDDFQSTLAFRAGIKSFDRVIEYNGINVEADSAEDFSKRFDNARDQPVELLVCSPATYAHYKKNGKQLHSNLEAVKHLNPVRDTIGNNTKPK
jgi:C-terminal processing protease CtpA/Prc